MMWTDKIMHHFQTMENHCWLAFAGESIILPDFLRWCRNSSINSRYFFARLCVGLNIYAYICFQQTHCPFCICKNRRAGEAHLAGKSHREALRPTSQAEKCLPIAGFRHPFKVEDGEVRAQPHMQHTEGLWRTLSKPDIRFAQGHSNSRMFWQIRSACPKKQQGFTPMANTVGYLNTNIRRHEGPAFSAHPAHFKLSHNQWH